jgi:hypothetical protein
MTWRTEQVKEDEKSTQRREDAKTQKGEDRSSTPLRLFASLRLCAFALKFRGFI